MTDRHTAYLVVLDRDIREDDAEHTINALRMVRGVMRVTPVLADEPLAVAAAEARVRREVAQVLRDAEARVLGRT